MFQFTSPYMEGPQEMAYRLFQNDLSLLCHSYDVYYLVQDFYSELPVSIKMMINKIDLCNAALLHDIGKSMISADILNKPGSLTGAEKEIIKNHAALGSVLLRDTQYEHLAEVIHYHHERIDGEGYYGLHGSDIPIESKIIAIADTYSALTSDRVYRGRCRVNKACKELLRVCGTQLDSELTFMFCNALRNIQKVKADGYRINIELIGPAYAN